MAEKISSSKYELIQETIANPEFKSKLSNILKEMSANDLASLIQNSPPPVSPPPLHRTEPLPARPTRQPRCQA